MAGDLRLPEETSRGIARPSPKNPIACRLVDAQVGWYCARRSRLLCGAAADSGTARPAVCARACGSAISRSLRPNPLELNGDTILAFGSARALPSPVNLRREHRPLPTRWYPPSPGCCRCSRVDLVRDRQPLDAVGAKPAEQPGRRRDRDHVPRWTRQQVLAPSARSNALQYRRRRTRSWRKVVSMPRWLPAGSSGHPISLRARPGRYRSARPNTP